mgnify:FL=1
MKKILEKFLAVTLSVSLLAVLPSCGTTASDSTSVSGQANEVTDSSTSLVDDTQSTSDAVGAYIQESMSDNMPDTYTRFYDLRVSQDGKVQLVGMNTSGKIQLLQQEASDWTVLAECDVPANATSYLSMSEDGTLWAIIQDDEGQYSLCTGTDSNALDAVQVDALSQSEALPVELRVNNDGTVFMVIQVGESTVFVVVNSSTQQVTTITPGFYGSPVFYSDGAVYAFIAGSTNLNTFDAENGNMLQQYQLAISSPLARACAATVKDNTLTWSDSDGIHQIALGGSIQQTFADNRSFALASSDFIQQQLVIDSEGSYWVSGTNASGQAVVYRYRFDPTATTSADNELVVWAMEDSFLLREALNEYAAAHPEQTVTVEYGSDSLDGGMTTDDVIRTLNVEIFAGEGPDVLVLDGLPVESYISQGVLADLSSIDTSGCYDNIVNCYQDDTGRWALPLLFRPCIMYCQSEENASKLSAAKSLTDLQDLLCVKNDFHYDGYYNLFSELYPSASASIFAQGAQSVNEDALREFLTVTKAVVDAQNITEEYDPLFGDGEDTVSGDDGQHLAVDIPVSMNWYGRSQDPADCAAGSPSDYLLTYIYMVSETQTVPALVCPMPGNVFVPVLTMGVLESSEQKESGIEFIQTMLGCETEEVAGRGSFNGYFVRQGIQLAKASQKNDASTGTPTPAELDLDSVMEQLTTPANTSTSLRELVYEEAAKLYTGSQDLETTLANILQRANLYYAEQS